MKDWSPNNRPALTMSSVSVFDQCLSEARDGLKRMSVRGVDDLVMAIIQRRAELASKGDEIGEAIHKLALLGLRNMIEVIESEATAEDDLSGGSGGEA